MTMMTLTTELNGNSSSYLSLTILSLYLQFFKLHWAQHKLVWLTCLHLSFVIHS